MTSEKDLQYPIGRFIAPENIQADLRSRWIMDIEKLPAQLREVFHDLKPVDLERTYRPGSWTIRQLFHHIGDSHMNAVVRFKWTLTEEIPTIKAYDEKAFAMLADYEKTPVEASLALIEALHQRWVFLLQSLTEQDYERTFIHPESGSNRLDVLLGHYSWHGRHHLAHIYQAIA